MDEFPSRTVKVRTGCGNLYVTLAGEARIIIKLGKAGGCPAAFLGGMSLLIHRLLELGESREDVARMLRGIVCYKPGPPSEGGAVLSCCDAVAGVLVGRV